MAVFVGSTEPSGSGGVWMGELKSSGKSFEISKWEVQHAWEKVKANKVLPAWMDAASRISRRT